jgi:hypothetical protein
MSWAIFFDIVLLIAASYTLYQLGTKYRASGNASA